MTPKLTFSKGLLAYEPITATGKLPFGTNYEEISYNLLVYEKGHFSNEPLLGIGLPKQLNGAIDFGVETKAREQFERIGYSIDVVRWTATGKLSISGTPPQKN